MTTKEEALIKYLEFSLIGLVTELKPYMKDDVSEEFVYGVASKVLDDVQDCISLPTGLIAKADD